MHFFYFIKLYEYWSNIQYYYETKKFYMEKITNLMVEEVIMSDRHLSDGQMSSFLQLFFNTKNIRLN